MKIHLGKRLIYIALTVLLAFCVGYLIYTGVALQ